MGEAEENSASRINVAVRCRPLSSSERAAGAQDICRVMDGKLVILMDPGSAGNDYLRQDKSKEKRYAFDTAFGSEASTRDLFLATARPLIDSVMQAYNATVFAYGATGAGKTFTMVGTPQTPGVMLQTVSALFEQTAACMVDRGRHATVKCSFVEVYNENLRDLLSPDTLESLDMREDAAKGMCVVGVSETEAQKAEEVVELLRRGNRNRTTEPTAMNVTSSRSHAVLQVTVEQREPGSRDVLLGKLSLIDLAGSERASQTENKGARLVEGANINKSLLALGNCINALASGCGFVPYRDSKLTRLLKDSLGGNCRTVMVANISPSHVTYEDTLNTLKYANRAKNIRLTARQNVVRPNEQIGNYQSVIEDLRVEVLKLKASLKQAAGGAPKDVGDEGEDQPADQEASEHWKEEVVKNLEGRTQLQRSLIEVDRGLTRWHVEKDRASGIMNRLATNGENQDGFGSPSGTALPSPCQLSPKASPRRGRTSGKAEPQSLEQWQEYVRQIDESIRENEETRRSIQQKLLQSKAAGSELQAQLPRRVVNKDLRAFLELIQRVQVLEVERLELDHQREGQCTQLEERDQEVVFLREQLRLRKAHAAAQRELLSTEHQQKLPRRDSMLGSTLAAGLSPNRPPCGPMHVLHAWAPAPKESPEEALILDNRPLREREPVDRSPAPPDLPNPTQAVDWGAVGVPHASQIRGLSRIIAGPGVAQASPPPAAAPLAAKGWQAPPGLSPAVLAPPAPPDDGEDGFQGRARVAAEPRAARRDLSCPPEVGRRRARSPMPDRRGNAAGRRPSREPCRDDDATHARARLPSTAQGTGPAPPLQQQQQPQPQSGGGPSGGLRGRPRPRARSEHGAGQRGHNGPLNRIGRLLVQPKNGGWRPPPASGLPPGGARGL